MAGVILLGSESNKPLGWLGLNPPSAGPARRPPHNSYKWHNTKTLRNLVNSIWNVWIKEKNQTRIGTRMTSSATNSLERLDVFIIILFDLIPRLFKQRNYCIIISSYGWIPRIGWDRTGGGV